MLVTWSLLVAAVVYAVARRRHRDTAPVRPHYTRAQFGLFVLLGVIALFLGGMGFWASFETVSTAAKTSWGFAEHPWQVPLTLDLAILGLDGWDMLDTALGRAKRWKRWPPRIGIVFTIFLNVQGAYTMPRDVVVDGVVTHLEPVPAAIAHGVLVAIYAVVVAYARDTIQTDKSDDTGDVIPWVRWVLQPYPTWLTWRMTQLENVHWRVGRETVAGRLIVRSSLKGEHSGWWSWVPLVGWRKVPIEKRALFRAGHLQGLSEAADRVIGPDATAPGGSGRRVAGTGKGRAAGGAAERSQPLPSRVSIGTGRNGSGAVPEGAGSGGVAGAGGRWVTAGLRVIESAGLRDEVADGVVGVAEALDALAAGPFRSPGNPSQDAVAEASGVSRPTVKKWWEAMTEVLDGRADGGDEPRLAVVETG